MDEAGNTALHSALYLIAFLQFAAPEATATLKVLAHAGADLDAPFPPGGRRISKALRSYPAAHAVYQELLAERRMRTFNMALP